MWSAESGLKLPRFAFLDLETTGGDASRDRITEIGIVWLEDGVCTGEWSPLINPGIAIPPEIQTLTGISNAMVRDAPPFCAVADELRERLKGCVLVAHNARFDYGFMKAGIQGPGRTLPLGHPLHRQAVATDVSGARPPRTRRPGRPPSPGRRRSAPGIRGRDGSSRSSSSNSPPTKIRRSSARRSPPCSSIPPGPTTWRRTRSRICLRAPASTPSSASTASRSTSARRGTCMTGSAVISTPTAATAPMHGWPGKPTGSQIEETAGSSAPSCAKSN